MSDQHPAKLDKAGQQFWNEMWTSSAVAAAVDPADGSLLNSYNRRFHQEFVRLFANMRGSTTRLLEIGCAKSAWLPYFAREFGFSVTGLDYSPIGSQMAREGLRRSGVDGEVVCTDLFTPPPRMLGAYDVVVSFGVAEHFEDTSAYLTSVAAYLKPGGLLITSIPNMAGAVGSLQKLLSRRVYDIHVIIDREMFRKAHEVAGLEVLECDYFMSTNFGVVNLDGVPRGTPTYLAKKVLLGVLARVSMAAWFVERSLGSLPVSRRSSPYVNCVARRRDT
jgi:2-polyprenyl-3-methyl-5-hydroxy-6-metoxy-1,4-benzoquinol methylase